MEQKQQPSKQYNQDRESSHQYQNKPYRGGHGNQRGGYNQSRGGAYNNYEEGQTQHYEHGSQYQNGTKYYEDRNDKNHNNHNDSTNNYRGGRGGYRGRGRGHYNNNREDQQASKPVQQNQTQQKKQDIKKTSQGLFSSDFDKIFGPKSTNEESKNIQNTPQIDTSKSAQVEVVSTQNDTLENESKIQDQISQQSQLMEEIKQTEDDKLPAIVDQSKTQNSNSSTIKHKDQLKLSNGTTQHEKDQVIEKSTQNQNNNQKILLNSQKKVHNVIQQPDTSQQTKQEEEKIAITPSNSDQNEETARIKQIEQPLPEQEEKKVVKEDFVSDPNFSYLDLEDKFKSKSKKKKKNATVQNPLEMPRVIQSKAPKSSVLRENVKMRIAANLEFSPIQIDKLNKGLTNSTNCCYMNVILQSLLSIPAFFNMILAISKEEDLMKEIGEDSILRRFVYLSLYFDPTQQMDRKSPYAANPVNAEKIFFELNQAFNPYQEHQDCHEFLILLLDQLHDELKKIYVPSDDELKQVVDEWQEIGSKNTKCKFNNDQQNIEPSVIRDIFGGVFRNEFQIGGSNNVSVTFEPFFVINLEVTRCDSIDESLTQFFKSKIIDDYKLDGKQVRATHQMQIDKLPNIMIVQLKRFIYRDGPVKLSNFLEFPDVLRIEDHCLAPHLRLGTFSKQERDQSGRSYRLASIVIHKGTQLSRGHYICYVLDSNNNWVQYDDNKIKKMIDIDSVFESQAYLLFYELM